MLIYVPMLSGLLLWVSRRNLCTLNRGHLKNITGKIICVTFLPPPSFIFSIVGRSRSNVGAQTNPSSRGEREGERLTDRQQEKGLETARED